MYSFLDMTFAFLEILYITDLRSVVHPLWNLYPKKSSGRMRRWKTCQVSLIRIFTLFSHPDVYLIAACSRFLDESNRMMSSTYLVRCRTPHTSLSLRMILSEDQSTSSAVLPTREPCRVCAFHPYDDDSPQAPVASPGGLICVGSTRPGFLMRSRIPRMLSI